MKNQNKQKPQQIAVNNSSDIDYWILNKDSMNVYKRFTAKSYSSFVIDCALASDYPLHFRKNILKMM